MSFFYYLQLSLGGSREGFIKTVERWTPTIWEDLYDVIGKSISILLTVNCIFST